MSEHTEIAWTDSTFNPWWGCQKVGPGCDNCYAETLDKRTGGAHWGPGAERRRTSAHNWNDPIRWNKKADVFFAEHGRRQRVFCSSMADVFDNEVDPQWRADLFWLIHNTPHLDWLLLTKRIGNAAAMMCEAMVTIDPTAEWPLPLPNVWLGATICSQEEADRDIPKLLAVPVAKRFLSMEPLLGPVDLTKVHELKGGGRNPWNCLDGYCIGHYPRLHCGCPNQQPTIDWVIVGGESGPKARPMHPDWARSLRDQCQAAGVPFLFKQWGEWTPGENVERQRGTVDTAFLWRDEWTIQPLNLATDGGHVDDQPDLYRVGKKAAGRFLDGREWNGVPI